MRTLLALALLAVVFASMGCEKTIHEARGPRDVQLDQLALRK